MSGPAGMQGPPAERHSCAVKDPDPRLFPLDKDLHTMPPARSESAHSLLIARKLEASSRKRYVSPYGLAQIYAALNQNEDTFKWLRAAYDDHAVWMGYLAVDPIFDRYRSDARFKNLLHRINLP
jgi:hypothetical protein